MKYLLSTAVLLFVTQATIAVAQENAAQLTAPNEPGATERGEDQGEDQGQRVESFAPAYELQFSYGRLAGVSLGIPIGSHLHLEGGIGAYDIAIQIDSYSDRNQVFGGNVRLRIDFASPTASFRPFVRVGGDLWRGRDFGGRWREWDLRLTAGAQVRLHRHFGIEVDAGVWYGRLSGDSEGRGLGLQYGLAMVIYI